MTLPNSSSINAYGSGVLVDAVPLVDPTSEMGAAALNPLRNDVAAMTATAPRCIFQFLGGAQENNPPVSTSTWTAGCDSVWGNAAPVRPLITNVSPGVYTVQMPATVSDQIGNNNNLVSVRLATAHLSATDAPPSPAVFSCDVMSASTFRIRCWDLTGTLNNFPGFLISVMVF